MKHWYNPHGRSIVNGGAAVRLTDNDNAAEVFVVRSLPTGKTAAFFANLDSADFFEGGKCNGKAEALVQTNASDIFSGWEESLIASFFQKAANTLSLQYFNCIQTISGEPIPDADGLELETLVAYDEAIIRSAKELGIL